MHHGNLRFRRSLHSSETRRTLSLTLATEPSEDYEVLRISRTWRPHRQVVSRAILTGLLLLAMHPFVLPAFGSPDPLSVRLGNYRFGHLSKPEAIVARVGPKGVAFEN